jgi:hypothetical protein
MFKKGQVVFKKENSQFANDCKIISIRKAKMLIKDCEGYYSWVLITDYCPIGIFYKYYFKGQINKQYAK